MTDEITESAKAIKEVAKTTGQAISTIEKIGGFFSKVMEESIAATCGMLADTLKYKRWERQTKLIDKAEKIIKDKKLSDKIRPIPPKLALPIFQYASLENDESLHDIWANLLVTALNPSCQIPRSSFIDIIRQLEPVDVKILNLIYKNHLKKSKEPIEIDEKAMEEHVDRYLREKYGDNYDGKNIIKDGAAQMKKLIDLEIDIPFPTEISLSKRSIREELNIDNYTYWTSIDNLIRQRLISSYIQKVYMNPLIDSTHILSHHYGYSQICITPLGVSFVKACTIID